MSEQCPKCGSGEVDGYGRQNGPFYECWSHTAIDKEGRAHFEQSFPCVERCALLAERDRWKNAVIEASVVGWTYRKEHEDDPRAAINALLCQQWDMALDPAISPKMAEIVAERDRLREQLAAKTQECQEWYDAANAHTYGPVNSAVALRRTMKEAREAVDERAQLRERVRLADELASKAALLQATLDAHEIIVEPCDGDSCTCVEMNDVKLMDAVEAYNAAQPQKAGE